MFHHIYGQLQGKFSFGKFCQKVGIRSDPPPPGWSKRPTFPIFFKAPLTFDTQDFGHVEAYIHHWITLFCILNINTFLAASSAKVFEEFSLTEGDEVLVFMEMVVFGDRKLLAVCKFIG